MLRLTFCRLSPVKSTCKTASSQIGVVSGGDPPMLKSERKLVNSSRVSRVAELWPRSVLPALFTYPLFIDDSDIIVEHVISLFMVLNYRTIIVELVGH